MVNAACLDVELELENSLIVVELQEKRKVTAALLLENPRIRALLQNRARDRFGILESPCMPMDVRQNIDQPHELLLNSKNVHLRHGCHNRGDSSKKDRFLLWFKSGIDP